jgi:hypothetical protein
MVFRIDNTPVAFDLKTFEKLCDAEGVTWMVSSLKDLRSKLSSKPAPTGLAILTELRKIPVDKRRKYKSAIKYVLFSWPGVVDASLLNPLGNGRMLDRKGFKDMFASMNKTTDFVDLQYGISAARGFTPYQLDQGRVRFADDFNNASNLGTGLAFGRQWNGTGVLGVTVDEVERSFRRGQQADQSGKVLGIGQATRGAYVEGMLQSRYSPAKSLGEGMGKLHKDGHQSHADMKQKFGKQSQANWEVHARWVKSVRRACKGGIAMVASHPGYRAVEAKVHFVLDGLGDLGKMARKDKLQGKDEYVAITSSELAFVCRYWNDPHYPLVDVVKFYIKGDRVHPPWDADYTLADAQSGNVYSNQEAWLRYRLSQDILGSTGKAFPKMDATGGIPQVADED